MKEKITLLLLKDTGNVLAATTRAAMADEPTDKKLKEQQDAQDLKALVGEALLVRFGGDPVDVANLKLTNAEFLVPPEELALLIGEFDAGVLQDARSFCSDDSQVPQPVTAVAAGNLTVAVSQTDVKFTVLNPVTSKTKVWIQIQDETGSDIQVVRGAIEPVAGHDKDVTLPLRHLGSGTYLALALTAGYQPMTLKFQ